MKFLPTIMLLVSIVMNSVALTAMEWPSGSHESKSTSEETSSLQHEDGPTEQLIALILEIIRREEKNEKAEEKGSLIAAMDELLARGADGNAMCCQDCGDTCLHMLMKAEESYADIIDSFIRHGVRINVRNAASKTALALAVESKKVDACAKLLEHGALDQIPLDILKTMMNEIQNRKYFSENIKIFRLLIRYGCVPILERNCWLDLLDDVVSNALLRSILLNDSRRVVRLLRHESQHALPTLLYARFVSLWNGRVSQENANVEDRQGVSALWYAVAQGNVAVTRELLAHGANPMVADNAPLRLVNRRLAAGGLSYAQQAAYAEIKMLLVRSMENFAMTFNRFSLPPEIMVLIAVELGMARLYYSNQEGK